MYTPQAASGRVARGQVKASAFPFRDESFGRAAAANLLLATRHPLLNKKQ